ncbi:MAG: exodeoxyribonuclease VII large subunit [Elusimicrobia bacterium GWA2_69_24]|nr:MAG: exodeoxyribonuclease VII large subunit [Elusimicrobia bacterium GWA2_69_24]
MIEGLEHGTAVSPITVSELSRRVKELLEAGFSEVFVIGEVSQPKTYGSGHTYFTLKDQESQLPAVLFKGNAAELRFELEHGLEVVARGRLSHYPGSGRTQLIVSWLQPKAMGPLQLAYEQLKRKLEAEGLFDPARKRPIPRFPVRIGLVTSLQGAAIRDMLSVLTRRFSGLDIRILPVPVQGADAAPRIAEAIADFNECFPDTEVLLVGRGGGSLEDLWAFNEESVARAIAASLIPVVSCVGHETDFTIADLAADLRAPTPSAAAELVVQDREALLEHLDSLRQRLGRCILAVLRGFADRLGGLARSPFLSDPARLFEAPAQRIDALAGRLTPSVRELLRRLEERLGRTASAPALRDPGRLTALREARVLELAGRLAPAVQRTLLHADAELRRLAGGLDALSPLKVLARGYAIVFKGGKQVVRSVQDVSVFDEIQVRLQDGELKARVT